MITSDEEKQIYLDYLKKSMNFFNFLASGLIVMKEEIKEASDEGLMLTTIVAVV